MLEDEDIEIESGYIPMEEIVPFVVELLDLPVLEDYKRFYDDMVFALLGWLDPSYVARQNNIKNFFVIRDGRRYIETTGNFFHFKSDVENVVIKKRKEIIDYAQSLKAKEENRKSSLLANTDVITDTESLFYSEELIIAIRVHRELYVSGGYKKAKPHREQIDKLVYLYGKHLPDAAKERISILVNPNKKGGATKSP